MSPGWGKVVPSPGVMVSIWTWLPEGRQGQTKWRVKYIPCPLPNARHGAKKSAIPPGGWTWTTTHFYLTLWKVMGKCAFPPGHPRDWTRGDAKAIKCASAWAEKIFVSIPQNGLITVFCDKSHKSIGQFKSKDELKSMVSWVALEWKTNKNTQPSQNASSLKILNENCLTMLHA